MKLSDNEHEIKSSMGNVDTVDTTSNVELKYSSALPNLISRVPSVTDCAKVFTNTKLIPYLEKKECDKMELRQNSAKVWLIGCCDSISYIYGDMNLTCDGSDTCLFNCSSQF